MKRILSLLLSVCLIAETQAQVVQASLRPLSTPSTDSATIVVTIKPDVTTTTRVSGVSLTLGIPVADAGAVNPPLIIRNPANTYVSWVWQYVGVLSVGGVDHHVYDFQGTGDVTQAAADRTYTAGADNELVRVNFNGDPTKFARIKLLSFPDFGTSGNSLFGLSFNGSDVADFVNPFYSITTISVATNSAVDASIVETTGLVPLPVKFLSFNAVKNNNTALLNWAVENEDGMTLNYEVEKSINGVDFSTVTSINALNNGRAGNSYNFTIDNLSAIRATGIIYFRIKQIDRDGRFVYTQIRSVRLDGKALAIGVYPNPIRTVANVSFDLESNVKVAVSVTDASGKQVLANQIQGFKGNNITKLDMTKFASGSYTLKVQAGEEVKVISIVKADQ